MESAQDGPILKSGRLWINATRGDSRALKHDRTVLCKDGPILNGRLYGICKGVQAVRTLASQMMATSPTTARMIVPQFDRHPVASFLTCS